MKKNLLVLSVVVAGLSVLLLTPLFTLAVAQEKEQMLNVGKGGDIVLSSETKLGDMTLRPGSYMVKYRLEGSDHFIHFTETGGEIASQCLPKGHLGELRCKLEPLVSKARQTAVYTTKEDGFSRVTKIVIKGENVAHLF